MVSRITSSRNLLISAGVVAVLAILVLAGVFLFGSTNDSAHQASASPATPTVAALAPNTSTPFLPSTDTPRPPTNTAQPAPSNTPSSGQPNTATATTAPPTSTSTSTVVAAKPPTVSTKAPAQAKAPAKQAPGVVILPNGVRYGDHYPNLPDRIVRIASPNIKLDCKVYEVYAKNGEWEVADYAAGHNYNSANPGEGGNIVVSGHNNWRGEVFRYLEFLQPGNEIDVWTLNGKEYKYTVQSIQKLKEAGATLDERLQHGHVMDPTPYEQLTLITCWPYVTYTHRLVVIAKPMK